MGRVFQLVVLVLLIGLHQAAAEDAGATAPESKEQRTLETFGAQNVKCEEWTDGCAVCKRQEGTRFACSLPGIACQPNDIICQREQSDRVPEKSVK